MHKLCVAFALGISFLSFGQNHEENFSAINTVQQAEDYASGFREVFTGVVHIEKDVFFFDDIDTSKMESYKGDMRPGFGIRSKIIQDSLFNIVKVQVIKMDLKDVSKETAEIIIGQMKKLLESGESYWDVVKKFQHTSAKYSSSPQIVEEVATDYKITENQMIEGKFFEWERTGESMGIVIIEEEPHKVPGFFILSYRDNSSGGF